MKNFVIVLLLLLCLSSYSQKRLHHENDYVISFTNKVYDVELVGFDSILQNRGINYGECIKEYRLNDGTRVDIVDHKYAIEADFANKWYEGVGQALYYSTKTGKEPAVLLIMENENDDKYLERFKLVARKYGITIFLIYSDFSIYYLETDWVQKTLN